MRLRHQIVSVIALTGLVGVAGAAGAAGSARAPVDPGHPGETATIDASFRLTWRPTDRAALAEIDDLVADGTHGISHAQMSTVAADGNRTLRWKSGCPAGNDAVDALDAKVRLGAWCFDNDDANNAWYPQGVGISRTPTLSGVLLSWYHKNSAGETDMTRITVGARPPVETDGTYRIVLLAVPTTTASGELAMRDVRPVRADLSTRAVDDLGLHAGGIAVAGDYLYVADTAGGFRVFNLTKPYQVATGKSGLGLDATDDKFYAHGAKYALFEEGRYAYDTAAGTCKPDTQAPDGPGRNLCFSTVSVDNSYPTPGLVSGEYRRTAGVVAGKPVRVVRWPLNADGSLRSTGNVVTSTTVYGTYTPRIQGVAARYDSAQQTTVYYNTSYTDGNGVVRPGTVYSDRGGRDAWSIVGARGAEAFGYDENNTDGHRLWSVTEHPNLRMLYWVYRDEMQPAGDS
ncbi:MAG TPA: hypothetical protein VFU43_09405 [Streptosporangiaceae bacterium]|nr:hypothetical protein [Streptosporangiaceae bacterium]